MARFLKPLVRSGGYYPSRRWTPLVYPGGYTTANGGEEPAPPPIEKTVIGNPIHITDALAKPAQALSIALEPIQAGSGDPSPTNIRPISGHTDADVIVSPTLNKSDGTTYPIPLGTTVYGGTLDAVTGVLTVDRAMVDLGSLVWDYNTTYAFFTTNSISTRKIGVLNVWSDLFKTMAGSWSGTPVQNALWGNGSNTTLYVQIPPLDNVNDFMALVDGHQLMYELATPIEITLTRTQIEMLLGENNLWSDGEMTLTYLADGNASDVEALNILLGGRYVNNHGEDEPTDREALNIVLGGNER